MERVHRNVVHATLVLLLCLGCASSSVQSSENYARDVRLPRPPVLMVYDFAVSANDLVEDSLGSEFALDEAPPDKEFVQAKQIADSLSKQLVAKLEKKGIYATHALDASLPPLHAMVLRGQFLTIDKGSRIKRMVIGFGAGSSEMQVRVQAYQATDWGLMRIAQAEVEAKGSKMPGMAVPMAGGAALGTAATSAVISGGMNIVKEVRGGGNADAGRIAGEIAARAEAFYRRQGWL